jgi:magnesium and cobalt exporter, CNNM family
MSDALLIFWITMAVLGFAGSALYSGLETGVYSLNRIRLQVLLHRGDRGAVTLQNLITHPTELLTTLLVGNNITNYLGTAALGVIIASRGLGDWEAILLNTLIVTPVLFVVGETLPKDLFAAHSDRLMYRLAGVLSFSARLFKYTGLTPLIGLFSGVLMKAIGRDPRVGAFHPRRQVGLLVREGVGYGLLSQEQSAIVDRVLDLAGRTVQEEMTGWQGVEKIRLNDNAAMIRRLAQRTTHARVPVLDRNGGVVGVLNLNEALAHEAGACPPIGDLMNPAETMSHNVSVRDALGMLQRLSSGLAIVTGTHDEPIGIVTVKDMIEPITGDLARW